MTKHEENLIEMPWLIRDVLSEKELEIIGFSLLKEYIYDFAREFEEEFDDADWLELDYNEELIKFTKRKLAGIYWEEFGDAPMDPETECIEQRWGRFGPGTPKEDIWHWFEETFDLSVAEDLMGR